MCCFVLFFGNAYGLKRVHVTLGALLLVHVQVPLTVEESN